MKGERKKRKCLPKKVEEEKRKIKLYKWLINLPKYIELHSVTSVANCLMYCVQIKYNAPSTNTLFKKIKRG